MRDIALLDQIIAHIEAHPEDWLQDDWAQRSPCGTTFCIAGHVARIRMPEGWSFKFKELYDENYDAAYTIGDHEATETISSFAADQLAISYTERDILFDGSNTLPEIKAIRDGLANGNLFDVEILYSSGNRCTLHNPDSEDCILYRYID